MYIDPCALYWPMCPTWLLEGARLDRENEYVRRGSHCFVGQVQASEADEADMAHIVFGSRQLDRVS